MMLETLQAIQGDRVTVYLAKLKSRREMERTIPRAEWGWWIDVSAGGTLVLRNATAADLARCNLKEGSSLDPDYYLCENFEQGSLVNRKAIEWLSILVPPTYTGGAVGDNTEITLARAREIWKRRGR